MRIRRSIDCVRLHLAILRVAAILLPAQQRAEWLAEWRSELWYVFHASDHEKATAFCLGAFQDALWLRRNSPRRDVRKLFRLESPLQCGFFLVALAAASLFFAFRLPGARDTIVPSPYVTHKTW